MNRILILFGLILISGLSLFTIVLNKENTYVECAMPICGTPNLPKETSVGRELFNSHCAACHKRDKNMTGPALRNITQTYDSITLYNFITGKPTKTLHRNTSNFPCAVFPQLTPEDISNLLRYTH